MSAVDRRSPSAVQLVFDTNILVDALLARGPYYRYAVELLDTVRRGEIEGWYAPHAVTTVYYLVERTLAREAFNRQETVSVVQNLVKKFMSILKPLPQVGDELLHLSSAPGDDLEDLLIVKLSADYLPNALIVTRDKWFLQKGACQAAHPKEIVESGVGPWLPARNAPVQFIDLAAQQRLLRPQIQAAIHRVLHHGQYIMGPEIRELEAKLAAYVGVKHAISCASGTDALLMALMAYGVGPGDAIFTTPFTFIATAEVISLLGATPVFVDIDPHTFNLDPAKLESAIKAVTTNDPSIHPLPASSSVLKAKGVIPVDLFGLPADYDRINAVARAHGLFVIEDAAQSFGAEYNGGKCCSLADIACTSFFPAKPLGCYGDGGMCFTDDDNLADVMKSIRVHGKGGHKYDNIRIGINGRLDTLQAAILLAKFQIFHEEVNLRRQAAMRYSQLLSALSFELSAPHVPPGSSSIWAQYSVLARDENHRAAIQETLKHAEIPTAIYYPKPLHHQQAFESLGYKKGDFPVSESHAERIFSIPMHPYLNESDQKKIAEDLCRI